MSRTPGVYIDLKKNGTNNYRSSITYRNKHISLGSYTSEGMAGKAYLCAKKVLDSPDLSITDYQSQCCLLFDKYVSLTNFRDNGIYISNPIYLYKHYFIYHLSPEIELKFDMDDLFYFSSHKIIQRGNHLFVSDYGMQQTISFRFGVRSYSVPGRDFVFINGDKHDFRRENLMIINRYNGVRKIQRGIHVTYKTVIHIRSNYIIGSYNTETEAAIAYNKAIDFLIKKGIKRNFTPNYIEDISPKEYASIYSSVNISPKIMNI